MNSYVGRNGFSLRIQDIATRFFFHFLKMAITNAFILFRNLDAEINVASNIKIR